MAAILATSAAQAGGTGECVVSAVSIGLAVQQSCELRSMDGPEDIIPAASGADYCAQRGAQAAGEALVICKQSAVLPDLIEPSAESST